jgi:hypothetical protein
MELAQQLHAVEKAIGNAKKELIKDHIHHCMEETSEALPREFRDLIKEFQGVTKYLERCAHPPRCVRHRFAQARRRRTGPPGGAIADAAHRRRGGRR